MLLPVMYILNAAAVLSIILFLVGAYLLLGMIALRAWITDR
jgi:hypothetical protein